MPSELVRDDTRFKRVSLEYTYPVALSDQRENWAVVISDVDRDIFCFINGVSIKCSEHRFAVNIEIIYPGINKVPSTLVVNYLHRRQNDNTILLGI